MKIKKTKIAQIGPYPPPDNGWSVRIKKLKDCFQEYGYDCVVLNTGQNRKKKSIEYIDVQNGFDYILKLFYLKLLGYKLHFHTNAQSVKGPMRCLAGHIISLMFFQRAFLTFHGGYKQLFFPKEYGKKMYWILYLNFFLAKRIICNDRNIKKDIAQYGSLIGTSKIFPIQAFSYHYLEFDKTRLPEKIEKYISTKKNIIITYIALRNGFYIDTLIGYIENSSDETAVVIIGAGKIEDKEILPLYERLLDLETKSKIVLFGSLNHDVFLTLMNKADIYLRTPDSDGISSSVLEAIASGTVVVASDNGRRPNGVVTYKANDAKDLQKKINSVLENKEYYQSKMVKPEILDTVKQEIDVLVKD